MEIKIAKYFEMENSHQNYIQRNSRLDNRKTEPATSYNDFGTEADITDMMAHSNEEKQKSVEEEKHSYKSFLFVLVLGYVSGLLTFGLVLCCTSRALPKPTEKRKQCFTLGVVVGLVAWLMIGVVVYLLVASHQFTDTFGQHLSWRRSTLQ